MVNFCPVKSFNELVKVNGVPVLTCFQMNRKLLALEKAQETALCFLDAMNGKVLKIEVFLSTHLHMKVMTGNTVIKFYQLLQHVY
jgi:hypothetical protein